MSKKTRTREKSCDRCQIKADILFRAQVDASTQWVFLCQTCCNDAQNGPHYHYGGTWKAQKRH